MPSHHETLILYYEFDFLGKFIEMRTSDSFEKKYKEFFNKDFRIDEEFKRDLSDKVLYYNGQGWTSEFSQVEKSR